MRRKKEERKNVFFYIHTCCMYLDVYSGVHLNLPEGNILLHSEVKLIERDP